MSKPRKRSRKPRELFLSHANADQGLAERLASTLRQHGVHVWFSKTNLRGAQQWHDEIGDALKRCDWFAVLLSPHSVRSRWVKHELSYALRKKRYEDRVIPILARRCRWEEYLSWTLGDFHFVDLASFENGCRDLLAVWGMRLDSSRLARPNTRRHS